MDSDFQMANLYLAVSYFFNQQLGEAFVYIEKVMDKIYLLPERLRYEAKYWYYRMHSEHDKMVLVQELLVSLYPKDVKAIWQLAMNYQSDGAYDKAEQLIKSALDFDDNRGEFYAALARLSSVQDRKEEALLYYQMYAQKYPDHTRSFQLLGDYYFDDGDFENAKQNYEKSLILSADNYGSLQKLILIKERQGLYKEAEHDFNSALERAHTIKDSLDIFLHQMNYYIRRGQINKAIQVREKRISTAENAYSPGHISKMRLQYLRPYYLLNQSDRALRFIYKEEIFSDSLNTQMSLSNAYLEYFIHNEDIARAEGEMEKLKPYLSIYGLSEDLANHKGDLYFINGEFEKAMEAYQQVKGELSEKEEFDIKIVSCLANLDRINEAKERLGEILNLNPYHAEAHLLLARIFINQHKNKEAKEHLLIANQVWENADEAFIYAQETASLLTELGL
jgi:tetratricopeptide (TPR) repeat protein